MRIIFSRKGFDSAAGGCPSPIVAGQPISLPIPTSMPTSIRFEDLRGEIGDMVQELTRGRLRKSRPCHLDPDLDLSILERLPEWRGCLGQVGAAQSHLARNGVTKGDLFLFWGLFRPASRNEGWKFTGEREHRIFGWLQVDEVVLLGQDGSHILKRFPWLKDHPHARAGWSVSNTLYVASERLRFGGTILAAPGWGLFRGGLRLTADDAHPSNWIVPDWLNPLRGGVAMTYHPPHRWHRDGKLQCAARGQEFVADIQSRPDAFNWLQELFRDVR